MFNIGKRYYVFEKVRFRETLHSIMSRKASTEWISQLILALSLAVNAKRVWVKDESGAMSPVNVAAVTALLILVLVVFGVFVVNLIRWIKNRNVTAGRILSEFTECQVDSDVTYILIVKRAREGVVTFLVAENEDWGLMFPYSTSKFEVGIDELKDSIGGILPGVDFNIEMLPNLDLNDEVKVHPRKSELARFSYRFALFRCESSYREFQNVLESDSQKRWRWMTMDDLYRDKKTIINNADVISHLNRDYILETLSDSFPSPPTDADTIPRCLKVIWNITDQCSYGCAFCGTHRGGVARALTFRQRIKVAVELKKIPGVRLDFAGGDPLGDESAVDAIRHITEYIIREDVCITTTGKSLKSYSLDDLVSLSREYDVSYDYPSRWEESHRGQQYNHSNYLELKRLGGAKIRRNVLVTLSATNTEGNIIREMAKELKEVEPDEVTLLRLMPVGKQSYAAYPTGDKYNPRMAIDRFRSEYKGKIKLQCAFRADEPTGCCNMLVDKIGVDHLGNVFACAWAGYLEGVEPEDNPFYLGNLVTQSMHDVFKSQRYAKMQQEMNGRDSNYCRIFSYVAGGKNAAYEKSNNYHSWMR